MENSVIPDVIWAPTAAVRKQANLTRYMAWLQEHKGLHVEDYQSLWEWSVEDLESFWESIWQYADIQYSGIYHRVMTDVSMPGTSWFSGTQLNYAEHIFRKATADRPAILFQQEGHAIQELSWEVLRERVAAVAAWLKAVGVVPGDRVVAYLPAIPEATIAFLACNAVGAIWSSCSPDFGAGSVLERFQQITPKVLLAADGYQYGGKTFSRLEIVAELANALPSVEQVMLIPYLDKAAQLQLDKPVIFWEAVASGKQANLEFVRMPFDHPIWVLYSSGTTGMPKAIVHGQGGVLLEHYKYLAFHNDVHPGERFFWYSTTGWMMWNFAQSSLLLGATFVVYDGSPAYPDLNVLWDLAAQTGIHHFGTSAPFLIACMKAGLQPGSRVDLTALRSIGSTGSPLPPEGFDYVREAIKEGVWLCSMSGGTDVCTAFVGGCPLEPVYRGEIQCRALGCALSALDDLGNPVEDTVGEMVIERPMPSMPVFFWDDPEGKRYRESYFEHFPGRWRHGDWVRVTLRGSLVIYGRSDATLNRHGIRIGTAEIYRCLDQLPEIADSLIVNLELEGGNHLMPLFVVLALGRVLDDVLRQKINQQLREAYSPRYIPDMILEVPEIPYTISGKKMETPVKKILLGKSPSEAASLDAMRNPHSLAYFVALQKKLNIK